MSWGPFYEFFLKKVTMPKKTERDFGIFHSVGKYQKKLKVVPFGENFLKKSHRAENTLREYPLAPLSFLDDVKILLRKPSKNCKKLRNCKIVRIVRKVDHSE